MNLDVAVFPERNLTSFSLFTLIDLGLVLEITPSFLNLNSVLEATSLTVPAIDTEGKGNPGNGMSGGSMRQNLCT